MQIVPHSILSPASQVVFILRVCLSSFLLFILSNFFTHLTFFCIGATITRPRLNKFYLDCIDQARAFLERSFHNLVTLRCLVAWGLGPEPTTENLTHKKTTRRSKYCPSSLFFFLQIFFFTNFILLNIGLATMKKGLQVELRVKRTCSSWTMSLPWLSRSLASRLERGRIYPALWTLVTFLLIEVPINRSLARLLVRTYVNHVRNICQCKIG